MTAPVDAAQQAEDLSDEDLFGTFAFMSYDPAYRAVIVAELERRHPALREQLDAVVLQYRPEEVP